MKKLFHFFTALFVGLFISLVVVQAMPDITYAIPLSKNGCNANTQCLYDRYLNPVIRLLSWTAGITVVIGIIWGAILYSSSAGDSGKVTKAKKTITGALIGLVAFVLLAPMIQFISPTNVRDTKANTCSNATFLGIKPWYYYFNADQKKILCDPDATGELAIMPTTSSSGKGDPGIIPPIALAIADGLIRIAAMVAVIFVITGGVQYMTSHGDPSGTKQSYSTIINAIIGLITALVAAIVVSFIGKALTS